MLQSLYLAPVQLSLGLRAEGLATLRSTSQRAQSMRSHKDSWNCRPASHCVVVAQGIHPQRDLEERRLYRNRTPLAHKAHRRDPDQNSELSDATMLALLDGDFDGAWQYASRIEALGLGAEYEDGVIVSAFALERDELVRQKAQTVTTGPSAPTAALYAALLGAPGGDAKGATTFRLVNNCTAPRRRCGCPGRSSIA